METGLSLLSKWEMWPSAVQSVSLIHEVEGISTSSTTFLSNSAAVLPSRVTNCASSRVQATASGDKLVGSVLQSGRLSVSRSHLLFKQTLEFSFKRKSIYQLHSLINVFFGRLNTAEIHSDKHKGTSHTGFTTSTRIWEQNIL